MQIISTFLSICIEWTQEDNIRGCFKKRVNILRAQILFNKIGTSTSINPRMKLKAPFMEVVVLLALYYKVKI